ncbi:MAG: hypothetical protein LN573_02550 [Rickettsia endosymbiont of Oxypoda opaca]|nr:hypothetical protein [Rickettsia endosymbiont of Oxypoda opaca]
MSKNANTGLSIAGADTDVVMHNNVPTGKTGTITLTSANSLTIEDTIGESLNSYIVFTEGKNIILCNNKYETLKVISLGETYEPSKIVFLGETAVEPTE